MGRGAYESWYECVLGSAVGRHTAALCGQMRDLVRAEQQRHLDSAAYRLLRHLESDLEAESLEIVRYYKACEHFMLCLWAQLMLPVASFKPEDDSRLVPI